MRPSQRISGQPGFMRGPWSARAWAGSRTAPPARSPFLWREGLWVGTLASERDPRCAEDKHPSERAGQAHLRDGIWVDLDGEEPALWGQTCNLEAWMC